MGQASIEHPEFAIEDTEPELWFHEKPGLGLQSGIRIKIERVVTRFKSEYQDIMVLDTVGHGRMLVLDGIIQLTEHDETSYQEMIAHVPLICHPRPKQVLIIGGGDGGAVREVIKHPSVERVVLCEIDPEVVRVAREYLPQLASGLDDERVEIIHADGVAYVAEHTDAFDVIITDSTDPLGPGEVLFSESYYRNAHKALTENGIATCQLESYFYHTHVISGLFNTFSEIFPLTAYYYTQVPTYPSGLIGFAFLSKGPHPLRDMDQDRAAALTGLEYYSPAIHRAAFALPPRALEILPEATRKNQAG